MYISANTTYSSTDSYGISLSLCLWEYIQVLFLSIKTNTFLERHRWIARVAGERGWVSKAEGIDVLRNSVVLRDVTKNIWQGRRLVIHLALIISIIIIIIQSSEAQKIFWRGRSSSIRSWKSLYTAHLDLRIDLCWRTNEITLRVYLVRKVEDGLE